MKITIDEFNDYIEKKLRVIDNMKCSIKEQLNRQSVLIAMKIDIAEMEASKTFAEKDIAGIICDYCKNPFPKGQGGNVCKKCWDKKYPETKKQNKR